MYVNSHSHDLPPVQNYCTLKPFADIVLSRSGLQFSLMVRKYKALANLQIKDKVSFVFLGSRSRKLTLGRGEKVLKLY